MWGKQTGLYLSTCIPHSFGQATNLKTHCSSWPGKSLYGISIAQERHFTVLLGQIRRCPASSRWYVRLTHPLPLNLHSTMFMSQWGRWLPSIAVGPVHLHPPGRDTDDGHFINLLLIAPSTARFLTNDPFRLDRSTGQWALNTCHCVIHSLQKECPSWQVTGWLKTP